MNIKNSLIDVMDIRIINGLLTTPEEMLRLRFAAEYKSIKILRDAIKNPIGYLVCAKICKECCLAILKNGSLPMKKYEWDEGFIILITDVVFHPQKSNEAIRELIKFIRKQRAIIYIKKNSVSLWIQRSRKCRIAFVEK